ncbi:hypothetical protein [Spiroplasma endosymbiont of Notiophilus biguttatus]
MPFECYKKQFFVKKKLENNNKINKDVQSISVSTPSLKIRTLKM